MAGAEASPDADVDSVADRPRRAVHQDDIHASRVPAAGGDGGVGWTASRAVLAFLPRVVIAVVILAAGVVDDFGVRRAGRRDSGVVNSPVRPLGVPRALELNPACHLRDNVSGRGGNRNARRAAVSRVGRLGFDFGRQQRVAGSVLEVGRVQFGVWIKNSVSFARPRCGRVVNEPRPEVETVVVG